ncbi:ER membrane protein complex subunit 4 [Strongyloides ratti]|uniref:ER membrane protein complex subunit 4 n=1 Tax=Strongyloides ratti TaxID=34506 RepID=A0A090LPJ6_STRRB|nr:ER membrane protein complex subunit 4 [Strongyloides ratti]CEF69465.1 ER membrane protein complex subunit 4 [Strongyloides ratti]
MASKKDNQNSLNRWKLDFTSCKSNNKYTNPPGFNPRIIASQGGETLTTDNKEQQQHLLNKRSWDMALQPIKSIPMNLFMMYMTGNAISIIPLMMVGSMFWKNIQAIVTVNSTFKVLEEQMSGSIILNKLVYIIGNLLGILLAMYKCNSMGLLPNGTSDWLDFMEHPEPLQSSTWSGVILI